MSEDVPQVHLHIKLIGTSSTQLYVYNKKTAVPYEIIFSATKSAVPYEIIFSATKLARSRWF